MAERKVISKYIPPDHVKLPQSLTSSANTKKKKKNNQTKIRMMAPMTMRCTSCGTYIYAGTKFNSRKETVHEEKYLDIAVFRFYQRCKVCGSEFTFKTDPKNQAYTTEMGCLPSYEPWKETREKNVEEALEEMEHEHDDNPQRDAIKELEEKARERKKEFETLDRLDQLMTRKDQHHQISVDHLIELHNQKRNEPQSPKLSNNDEFTEEQQEKMRRLFGSSNVTTETTAHESPSTKKGITSLSENVAEEIANTKKRKAKESNGDLLDSILMDEPSSKRRKPNDDNVSQSADTKQDEEAGGVCGLFAGYSSD